MLRDEEMRSVLETLLGPIEHCEAISNRITPPNEQIHSRNTTLFVSLRGVKAITRRDSSIAATPTRSSAAPGDGRVLSVCALTRTAFALEAAVPSERRTITLVML